MLGIARAYYSDPIPDRMAELDRILAVRRPARNPIRLVPVAASGQCQRCLLPHGKRHNAKFCKACERGKRDRVCIICGLHRGRGQKYCKVCKPKVQAARPGYQRQAYLDRKAADPEGMRRYWRENYRLRTERKKAAKAQPRLFEGGAI